MAAANGCSTEIEIADSGVEFCDNICVLLGDLASLDTLNFDVHHLLHSAFTALDAARSIRRRTRFESARTEGQK